MHRRYYLRKKSRGASDRGVDPLPRFSLLEAARTTRNGPACRGVSPHTQKFQPHLEIHGGTLLILMNTYRRSIDMNHSRTRERWGLRFAGSPVRLSSALVVQWIEQGSSKP